MPPDQDHVPPDGPAHSDSDGLALNCSSDVLECSAANSPTWTYPRCRRQASPRAGPSRLRADIRLLLAVYCLPDTGAGCRQLDPVTSTFLPHLPGPSLPHAGQDNQYQRFSRAKIYPGPDAGDHAPPTLAPRRGRCIAPAELSARRQLDLVGLGLDWFPSISRDMGRPRTRGCQERTTFRPPPQGPDSDWTHPRRLQCHPGADPIAPECSSSTGLGHVPAGSRPSSGRNRRSVSNGTYALTAPPRKPEARVHDGPTAV